MAKPNFQLIWGETAPSVPIPAPSYAAGWDAYLGSTPPLGSDHDYVMNQHDIKLAYLNQQGIAEWDAITSYPEAAYVKGSDGEIYRSTAPTTGNDPIAGGPWISANSTDFLNTVRQDVASAVTTVLPDTTRHVNITGTAIITAFTVAAGNCYFVRFDGAATLTNNASIVTQSGANIVANTGDTCILRATAENIVEILCYTRAVPVASRVVRIESASVQSISGAVTGPVDYTPLSYSFAADGGVYEVVVKIVANIDTSGMAGSNYVAIKLNDGGTPIDATAINIIADSYYGICSSLRWSGVMSGSKTITVSFEKTSTAGAVTINGDRDNQTSNDSGQLACLEIYRIGG